MTCDESLATYWQRAVMENKQLSSRHVQYSRFANGMIEVYNVTGGLKWEYKENLRTG